MADNTLTPAHVARRIAARRDRNAAAASAPASQDSEASLEMDDATGPAVQLGGWRRECFTLPTSEAQATVREWLARYPQARWRSDVENWRIVGDNLVQVTMRRLPEAD